jgi:hypothetical protein
MQICAFNSNSNSSLSHYNWQYHSRLCLKCDGTRTETRFRLSTKGTSPFKSAGASVPSTTGSRGVRISCSNAGYTMFRGSVKSTGFTLHSPVSPSLPLSCVTVCHHISTGLYRTRLQKLNGTQLAQKLCVLWKQRFLLYSTDASTKPDENNPPIYKL